MRLILLLATLGMLAGCGSGGGGGGGQSTAAAVDVTVTVADVANPHGYWRVRELNSWGGNHERTMVISFLHDGDTEAITAVPDAGYHVVWSGTDNDASASNANTFHASAGKVVTVGFAL